MPVYENCTACCGGGGITTACCPSDPTPTTLFFTPSGYSAGCACANGAVITLTYDSGAGVWIGSGTLGTCGTTIFVRFGCDGGSWKITVSCTSAPTILTNTMTSVTCNPFSASKSSFALGG